MLIHSLYLTHCKEQCSYSSAPRNLLVHMFLMAEKLEQTWTKTEPPCLMNTSDTSTAFSQQTLDSYSSLTHQQLSYFNWFQKTQRVCNFCQSSSTDWHFSSLQCTHLHCLQCCSVLFNLQLNCFQSLNITWHSTCFHHLWCFQTASGYRCHFLCLQCECSGRRARQQRDGDSAELAHNLLQLPIQIFPFTHLKWHFHNV